MDVDVCQAIAEEVVKERDVQKSTLDPVALCVAEHKVKSGHEEDVEGDKEEEGDRCYSILNPRLFCFVHYILNKSIIHPS